MVHEHYVLKHSDLSTVFQSVFLVIISIVLYFSVATLLWAFASSLLLITWYLFNKKPQIKALHQLDQRDWSIQLLHNSEVYPVSISHFVDHYFYIVIYFSDSKIKNMVIWKDQMDLKAWKNLKIRAKLG